MNGPAKIKVISKHKDFASIGAEREVTEAEAKLLISIGRAELVNDQWHQQRRAETSARNGGGKRK